MNSSPDWLPDGWGFEVRTQKGGACTGRKIKSYYDPLTKSRFYSKKAVFRYLEAQKSCSPKTKGTRTVSRKSIKEALTLTSQEEKRKINSINYVRFSQTYSFLYLLITSVQLVFIVGLIALALNGWLDILHLQENAPDGLPHGWIKETRFRNTKSQVKKDMLYTDPVSGYIFRSLKDVFRYLKTGDIRRCAARPMKRRPSNACALNQEFNTASATKKPESCGAETKRCLYSNEKLSKKGNIDIGMVESPEGSHKLCNGDAYSTEKINFTWNGGNMEDNKVTAMINPHNEVAISNKDRPQTKNKGQGNQSHPKKTRAFCMPVRASKRLAALEADSATISETVEALPGAIKECSDKLKTESAKELDHSAGSTAKFDHHESSRIVLEPYEQPKKSKVTRASIMPVQASKHLAAPGVDLTISARLDALPGQTIEISDTLKAESDKVLDLSAVPIEKLDHQESSTRVLGSSRKRKKTKVTEASSVSVRSSKRLAGLRADPLTTYTVVGVLPGAIIEHFDKLKTETAKILDHNSVPTEKIDHQESSTVVSWPSQNIKKSKAAKDSTIAVQSSNWLAALRSDSLTTPANAEVLSGAAKEHLDHRKEQPAVVLDRGAGSTEKLGHLKESSPTPEPFNNLPSPPEPSDNRSCQKPDDNLPPNIQLETLTARKEESGSISPFGDSWPDPCIEFAFKTLTGDIPFLDDSLTFEDYFNQPMDSDISPVLGASLGSTKIEPVNENKDLSPVDPRNQHLFTAKDDGRPSSLGNGGQSSNKFN